MKTTRWLTIGIVALMSMFWHSPAHAAFVDNGNGTVSDTVTGLIWQMGDSQNDGDGRTWEEALNYCECLTLPSGAYSDWRLPNVRELETLVDWDRYNPSIDPLFSCRSSGYWTSSTNAIAPKEAWSVYFSHGNVYSYDKDDGPSRPYCVRCVRGGPSGSFGNLDHFVISNTSGGDIPDQAVNAPFSVLIKAVDAAGRTVTSFNGSVYLTSNLGDVSVTIVPMSNGIWSGTLSILGPGKGYLEANGGGRLGRSNEFAVTGAGYNDGWVKGEVVRGLSKVSGATVYLKAADGTQTTKTTNQYGAFAFTNLVRGTYSLWAEVVEGDTTYQSSTKQVTTNANQRIDLTRLGNPDQKIPILLIPGILGSSTGYGGPYPTLPTKSPDWDSGKWDTDSHGLHDPFGKPGWRNLIEALEKPPYSYKYGENIFAVPYDWTLDLDELAEKYLKKAIEHAKAVAHTDQVDIVAHSNGGLVVRYYIKHYGGSDIRRFAMAGTPNKGSANPYFMYFGGDPKLADDSTEAGISVVLDFYSRTTQLLYLARHDRFLFPIIPENILHKFNWDDPRAKREARDFYQDEVKLLRTLLPVYPFLVDRSGNSSGISETNKTLIDLNEDVDEGVETLIFAGNDEKTIEFIHVGKPSADLYTYGTPWGVDKTTQGDGTVLVNSARIGSVDVYDTEPGAHSNLLNVYCGNIIAFIIFGSAGVTQEAGVVESETPPAPALSVNVTGDVTPLVEDPQKRRIGVLPGTGETVDDFGQGTWMLDGNHGSIMVENPVNGVYTLQVACQAEKEFQVTLSYTSADKSNTVMAMAFNHAGVTTIRFEVNSEADGVIAFREDPARASNLKADPIDQGGLKTRLTWEASPDPNVVQYRVYARQVTDPFLTLRTTVSGLACNMADAWAADAFIPVTLYAVAAVKADGSESLLTDLVQNDDRDHDGLTDPEESTRGTSLTNADSDGDGLKDGEEVYHGTKPLVKDTDGDGYNDYAEIQCGSDPLDPASVPTLPAEERQALVALYDSTNGSGWTNKTGWKTEADPCGWSGVRCSNGHVTELWLDQNSLSGTIPPEIGNLSHAKRLQLGWNQLTGSIPSEIGNLINLQILELVCNQLTGAIPVQIGNLSDLKYLRLGWNQLSGDIPSEIWNLLNLEHMDLYLNNLTGTIPAEVANLAKLKYFRLGWNQLTGSLPEQIGDLTQLEEMDLSVNQFSGTIPSGIVNLSKMKNMWLCWNQLTGPIPEAIGSMANLEILDLTRNQLTGAIPLSTGNLVKLTELNLSYNQLTGVVPAGMGNLVNMKKLHLSGNQFTTLPDNVPRTIDELYLQENNLTFESLEPYFPIPFNNFTYAPQALVPVSPNVVCVTQGQNLSLSVTVGGEHNRYQWFKDGVAVSSVSTSPAYSKSNVTASDAGTYVCHITNTVVTGLTLYTEDITVTGSGSGEYLSGDAPKEIMDQGKITSALTLSESGVIESIQVKINISHTCDADLDVYLIGPDGTRVELFTDVGGSGNNFTDTILDDEAGTGIAEGSAPFTGTYRPEGSLTAFEGKSLPGTWVLEITDDAGGDVGTLNRWSLLVTTTVAGPTLPTVTTASVSAITPTSAKSGGNVSSNGGAVVTARGICWRTSEHPTTENSHTSNGTGEGSFTSNLTGLIPGTRYYVCAYAVNSEGTSYGMDVAFTTHYSGMRYVHPFGSCGQYQPCHSSIQGAIDAAADGDTILVRHGDYYETIVLDEAKSLKLLCGRNDSFGPGTMFSTAYDLEIRRGSVIVEGLQLVGD